MGNLTPYQPEETATVKAIYEWWQKQQASEKPRGYMGASQIGIECDRRLWYAFRVLKVEEFEGRILRLFNRGHREEYVFIRELEGIGCEVMSETEFGEQIAVSALGGHFRGHMDGAAVGIPEAPKTWHVLEFKTHNAKSFAHLKANGVKVSKPQHYQQMMVYMGMSKMTRALYLAVNKDNDELYSERIRYDATEFKAIMLRAKRIIDASVAPDRIANRSDDWRCKFCPAHALCWGLEKTALPIQNPRNCRTCCHATARTNDEGGWYCERHKRVIDDEELDKGCDNHLLLPSLVYGSSPIDATDNSITYETEEGVQWVQGPQNWTVEELQRIGQHLLEGDNASPLPLCFPHEDSERIWDGPEDGVSEAVASYIPAGTEVTQRDQTDDYVAVRYGDDYLLMIYSRDMYAAIWKGKE